MRRDTGGRRHSARAWLALALAMLVPGDAGAESIAVIVHRERDAGDLPHEVVAQIYLRQRAFWPEGPSIVPINREAGSAIRDGFSRRVLGRSAIQLRNYWNQRYFQGVLPPATLASDEAVRRFVAAEPRAIGYIAASAVDDSVRVVLRLDDPE